MLILSLHHKNDEHKLQPDKQLYSIAAIGVLFITISHWIPKGYSINTLPNGATGVSILFVLTGYVLSCLLFEKRAAADGLSYNKRVAIKDFYLLCIKRIFPVYYLTLLLLFIFYKTSEVSETSYIYFATFTSNFYFYKIHAWGGLFSHLWILAAMAQFFLFWPWVILFTEKKYLPQVIVFFISIGVITQFIFSDVKLGSVLPFTCFDSFALGALLAWVTVYKQERLKQFFIGLSVFSLPVLLVFVISILKPKWINVPARVLISTIALWLISYTIYRQKNIFSFLLNRRPLVFIGIIGYGVFLYHNILPSFTWNFLKSVNRYLPASLKNYTGQVIFVENFLILLLFSWLSWMLIEKRFFKMKDHSDTYLQKSRS